MPFTKNSYTFRAIAIAVLAAFFATNTAYLQAGYAEELNLPSAGTILSTTGYFSPPIIMGIKVDPQNPLAFDFLIDPGKTLLTDTQKKIEYRQLITYFLASLTTSEKDMWVNLSPYEHNRVISHHFGATEMGRDMLAQDYILKQLTASLIYPESNLGKKFWDRIYTRVKKEFGSTDVAVNTFNKVWILPDSATVFERGNVAIVLASHMKVMLEEDYMSLSHNPNMIATKDATHGISSQIIREIILPELEREVNEGKDFAQLRQMFNSMVLASWFKQRLKGHGLHKVYADQNKNAGLELQDPKDNERVYRQYIRAFKKGVFNYIREEPEMAGGPSVARKYFSGGFNDEAMLVPGKVLHFTHILSMGLMGLLGRHLNSVSVNLAPVMDGVVISKDGQELNVSELTSLTLINKDESDIGMDRLKAKLSHFRSPQSSRSALELLLNVARKTPVLRSQMIQLIKYLAKVNEGLGVWQTTDIDQEVKLISDLTDLYLSAGNNTQSVYMNVRADLKYDTQGFSPVDNQIFAGLLSKKLMAKAGASGPMTNQAKALGAIAKNVNTIATHVPLEGLTKEEQLRLRELVPGLTQDRKDKTEGFIISADKQVLYTSDITSLLLLNNNELNIGMDRLKAALSHFRSLTDSRLALGLLMHAATIKPGLRPQIIQLVKYLTKLNAGLGAWGTADIGPETALISGLVEFYLSNDRNWQSVYMHVMVDLGYDARGFSPQENLYFAKGLTWELIKMAGAPNTTLEKTKALNAIAKNINTIAAKNQVTYEDYLKAKIKAASAYRVWQENERDEFAAYKKMKDRFDPPTAEEGANDWTRGEFRLWNNQLNLLLKNFKFLNLPSSVSSREVILNKLWEGLKGKTIQGVSDKELFWMAVERAEKSEASNISLRESIKADEEEKRINELYEVQKQTSKIAQEKILNVASKEKQKAEVPIAVFPQRDNTSFISMPSWLRSKKVKIATLTVLAIGAIKLAFSLPGEEKPLAPAPVPALNPIHAQSFTRGGIDFNDKYLQMNMEGDGANVPCPKGFEWLLLRPIRGFVPEILEIQSGVGSALPFFKNLITAP